MPITVTACALGLLIHARVFSVWASPGTPISFQGGTTTAIHTIAGAYPAGVPMYLYCVQPLVPGGDVLVVSTGPLEVWAYGEVETAVVPETAAVPVLAYAPVVVRWAGPGDIDCDGDAATDADIASWWECLRGECGPHNTQDFDLDGDFGTDLDIQAVYRTLAGNQSVP